MDSLTQFALGSTLGAAFLGRRIGVRNAVIIGGLYGTLPDLDTFLPASDPVSSFTTHRGATHSWIIQAVATPLFAEPLVRLFKNLKDARIRVYAAVYVIFATHALIDAMTVYGTQLFWPFGSPLGVGSVFIIDPLYTLPLLLLTVWGIFVGGWSERYGKWLTGALAVSTVYMASSYPLQSMAENRANQLLAQNGIEPEKVLAIPTPFNTLFWRAIAIDGPHYYSLYIPLIYDDASVTAYRYDRGAEWRPCLAGNRYFQQLAAFTDGYYRIEERDDQIIMADLRMGLTPNYVFRFALAENGDGEISELNPPTRERLERNSPGDLDWLRANLMGDPVTRPIEAEAQITLNTVAPEEQLLAAGPCERNTAG